MPTLWDPTIQEQFANACAKLEDDWSALIPAMRQNRFKLAVNEVARSVHMPEFTFHFSALGPSLMGNFDFQNWRMNMNESFTKDKHVSPKTFYKFCSTLYHETRHAEQWYRCVEGVLNGLFPLPLWGRAAKSTSVRVAGHKAQDVADYMWVPRTVVDRAQMTRRFFPTSEQAIIQGCYDSIYGVASQYRGRVLGTMSHSIDGYKRYLNLPEEVDAWNLERTFRRRLKSKILDRASDEAWGLQDLFD